MNDDALSEFFGRWMSAALELYQQARQGVRAIAPYNPLAAMPFAAGNVISRMLSVMPGPWMPSQGFSPAAFAPAQPPAEPSSEPVHPVADVYVAPPVQAVAQPAPADAASVEALRRELDELKAALRGGATSASPERAHRKRETPASKTSGRKRG